MRWGRNTRLCHYQEGCLLCPIASCVVTTSRDASHNAVAVATAARKHSPSPPLPSWSPRSSLPPANCSVYLPAMPPTPLPTSVRPQDQLLFPQPTPLLPTPPFASTSRPHLPPPHLPQTPAPPPPPRPLEVAREISHALTDLMRRGAAPKQPLAITWSRDGATLQAPDGKHSPATQPPRAAVATAAKGLPPLAPPPPPAPESQLPSSRLAVRMAALASLQPYVRQVLAEPYEIVRTMPYGVLERRASAVVHTADTYGTVHVSEVEQACQVCCICSPGHQVQVCFALVEHRLARTERPATNWIDWAIWLRLLVPGGVLIALIHSRAAAAVPHNAPWRRQLPFPCAL